MYLAEGTPWFLTHPITCVADLASNSWSAPVYRGMLIGMLAVLPGCNEGPVTCPEKLESVAAKLSARGAILGI